MLDTVFLVLRVVITLAAVFGALLFAHRWVTKGRPGGPAREKQIAIVARQGLGAKAGIAIVDAAGRRYLLGVTEHAVTVLDTLGDAPASDAPSLVSAQPLAAARFEQELRTVTLTTGPMPAVDGEPMSLRGTVRTETVEVVLHGRPDPRDPSGPITQTIAILPEGDRRVSAFGTEERPVAGLASLLHADGRMPPFKPARAVPIDPASSRRAVREAEQRQQVARQGGPLAGSVLSPGTWRQTFDALKKLR